jgi:hypothetical protein
MIIWAGVLDVSGARAGRGVGAEQRKRSLTNAALSVDARSPMTGFGQTPAHQFKS